MAKAKRKTLPKNFGELIKAGDMAALKAVFDACEINAYNNGFDKSTALHQSGIPDELVRWLVEQGADINARNHYEKTPLHEQAGYWRGNAALLIELGADINAWDMFDATPLHYAVCYGRLKSTRELIAHGADIHAKAERRETPLADALRHCDNVKIPEISEVAEILIGAGAKITPDMAKTVKRIGEQFEFIRADFDKERLERTEAGLFKLYALFGVEPVPGCQKHEDNTPIVVPEGKWHEQHEALWKLLVPGRGAAKTVQGELVRLSGKLAREIMDNGGINWDDEFRKMLFALPEYFGTGNPLDPDELKEVEKLTKRLQNGRGDDEPERLMELAVRWVRLNPEPMDRPDGNKAYTR